MFKKNKINLLTTGGKGISLKSIAANTQGNLKFSMADNIETIKKDTFNPKNNFFSARRSLKKKNNDYGRNISIIMIK